MDERKEDLGSGAVVPSPPPADEEDAHLDAVIRLKLEHGERPTREERAYLARLPGDKDVTPAELRRLRERQ